MGTQELQPNYIPFFLPFIAKGARETPAAHFEFFTSTLKVDFAGLGLLQEPARSSKEPAMQVSGGCRDL